MMLVEPLHEWSAGVQSDSQRVILLEDIEERTIAVFVSLLEDTVEIADRLMIMQDQQ
jgi:hypothetical protein